ncbi:hypothetical protein R5R35_001086 [Gryllus longicercus]|uniref:Kelch domain-containing protein 3 n=1 Tax=Gryllus longicercus TaxID=2509291 RepID=A0AAN9W0C6_9ORTH|nr:Host cell factor [Gryllus bimaculatus]
MHWTLHLNGAPRRVEHAAVALGDKIYFIGGYCETEVDFKKPIVVNLLNTRTYRWSILPTTNERELISETPYLLRGHSAAVYGDKIYVWGGRNYAAECDVLLCFDSVTLKWSRPKVTGSIPDARYGHTACVIDNCMYIFGGEHSSRPVQSNDVHCLDLLSMNWKRVYTNGDPPPCLSFSAVQAVGKRMYIFGGVCVGSTPTNYYPDIVYLDTSTRRWHKPIASGSKPPVRGKPSAFVHNGYFYVFGGYNARSGEHFNDIHRFHLEKNEWKIVKPLGELPKARHRHSSLLVGEKVFVFGGTSCFPFSSVSTGLTAMVLFHRNDVHVLDLSPSLRTLCLQVVIKHKLDTNILPQDLKRELFLISPEKSVVIYV